VSARGSQGETGLFGEEYLPENARPASKVASKAAARSKSAGSKPERPEPPAHPGPFARVVLPRPMRTEYTYAVDGDLVERVRPGMRVRVTFARRREIAVVVGVDATTDVPARAIRPIEDVLDAEPVIGPELLDLTRFIANEYACSWGEALAAALPAPLKRAGGSRRVRTLAAAEGAASELEELEEKHPKQYRLLRTLLEVAGPVDQLELLRRLGLSDAPAKSLVKKGLAVVGSRAVETLVEAGGDRERPRPTTLTEGQSWAVEAVDAALRLASGSGQGRGFLLQGVTGSGKTEVYLQVIERALARGLGAICLVPEIALTPQTVGWFRSRFGEVAVLHSRLTDAQRLTIWQQVRRGELRVVVGARSAVFAPVENLGVIVIDEEHEPSFKQGNVPRYHARDVALERVRACGAVCLLGSATPSLESWQAVKDGRLSRLMLDERVGGGALPPVDVVDMRTEPAGRLASILSRPLRQRIDQAVLSKEQVILFLNRRGFAPVLWCQACRTVVRCPSCDSSLTYHRHIERMVCHQCHLEQRPPKACPSCTAPQLRMLGAGSERVQKAIEEMWPDFRVRRMDSDTMVRREDYEETLGAFGRGEIDVLVGTQMIAKGLDFPGVTLVGIISADTSLHLPDFRAAERTFQLLAQVAGRAGRGERPGQITVQTESPEHPAVRCATTHDFESFAAQECESRREFGYPPFGRLLRVVVEDDDAGRAASEADAIASELRELVEGPAAEASGETAVVLGPAPAPMSIIRDRHRHHVLVKAAPGVGDATAPAFVRARDHLADRAARTTRPRLSVDVDPVSML
jgi:primosomal protein N' (replication factor Y) (superfamily II helicase)